MGLRRPREHDGGRPGTFVFNPTVTVPAGTSVGLYEGQIEVANGTDISTIPVVVNVAMKGGSVFNIGGAGPRRLYDNSQMRSYEGDGEFRPYFFDTPDTFLLRPGQRWTVDLALAGRDSYLIPRHAQASLEGAFQGLVFS